MIKSIDDLVERYPDFYITDMVQDVITPGYYEEGGAYVPPVLSDPYPVYTLKPRCQGTSEEYINTFIKPKYDEELIKVFFGYWQETDQWAWYDEHLEWDRSEPETTLEEIDEFGEVEVVPNPAHTIWLEAEPLRPEAQDCETWLQTDAQWMKLRGVEFEGIMCSATKEDMWGLNSVQAYVAGGASTNFKFDNGSVLHLTPDNYVSFMGVWVPFRQSFFN